MKLTNIVLGTSVSVHVTRDNDTFTIDGIAVHCDPRIGLVQLVIEHIGYPDISTWNKADASYVTNYNKYIYFSDVGFNIQEGRLYIVAKEDGVFKERRMHPRFSLNIPCAFQAKNSESVREGVLRDISRYGAGIITMNPILNTDSVILTLFDRINKVSITVEGKIVREVKNPGKIEYGLQLEDNKLISNMCYSLTMQSLIM